MSQQVDSKSFTLGFYSGAVALVALTIILKALQ